MQWGGLIHTLHIGRRISGSVGHTQGIWLDGEPFDASTFDLLIKPIVERVTDPRDEVFPIIIPMLTRYDYSTGSPTSIRTYTGSLFSMSDNSLIFLFHYYQKTSTNIDRIPYIRVEYVMSGMFNYLEPGFVVLD